MTTSATLSGWLPGIAKTLTGKQTKGDTMKHIIALTLFFGHIVAKGQWIDLGDTLATSDLVEIRDGSRLSINNSSGQSNHVYAQFDGDLIFNSGDFRSFIIDYDSSDYNLFRKPSNASVNLVFRNANDSNWGRVSANSGVFEMVSPPYSLLRIKSYSRGIELDALNSQISLVTGHFLTATDHTTFLGTTNHPKPAISIGQVSSETYEFELYGDMGISGGIYGLSDTRVKENIEPLKGALARVCSLSPKTYYLSQEQTMNYADVRQYGLIAQEVQKILPELVREGKNDENLKYINYVALIPILVQAIKEQQDQINALQEIVIELQTNGISPANKP